MLDILNSTLGIIASALVILGIGGTTIYMINRKNLKAKNGIANENHGPATNVGGGHVTSGNGGVNVIGNNNTITPLVSPSGNEHADVVTDLKSICQILFIDDDRTPSVIKPLRKSGWKNIKKIGDTANLDLAEIRNADIIFVDILGVGKELQFENEGVGLAATIKKRYPQKAVVIYSATSEHNLFDPDIDILDGRLSKNAEPIQFSNMIEEYAKPKD